MRKPEKDTHVGVNRGVRVYAESLTKKPKFTSYSITGPDLEDLDALTDGNRTVLYQVIRHVAATTNLSEPVRRNVGGNSTYLVRRTKRYLKTHPEIIKSIREVAEVNNAAWDKVLAETSTL